MYRVIAGQDIKAGDEVWLDNEGRLMRKRPRILTARDDIEAGDLVEQRHRRDPVPGARFQAGGQAAGILGENLGDGRELGLELQ